MPIIIGLILAGALLYAWLSGWWFARVLVTLLLLACVGLVAAATDDATVKLWCLGIAVAVWPIADAPSWFKRRAARRLGSMHASFTEVAR
jgi:hypothetical protein